MFTHVFKWTISCIAIHTNSLSLPISKRTMWREKEKDIERRSQRIEHEWQPNLRPRQWSYQVWLSNWVLDVCLPRRCWNPRRATKPTKPWVVLVSTVPLPGQTLATGLRCEKKRRVCNFVQRGRMLGWDWWNMMDLDMDMPCTFFWCLMCLLPTMMMLAWRECQGSLVATLDPAKVAALFGPSPSRTSPGAVGREKHRLSGTGSRRDLFIGDPDCQSYLTTKYNKYMCNVPIPMYQSIFCP